MQLFTLIAILKVSIFSLENRFDEKAALSEPSVAYQIPLNVFNKKQPGESKESSTIREFVNRLLSLENIIINEKTIEKLESFLGSELLTVCVVRETIERTSESVEEAGGLHVCVSFLPRNLRVELQAVGRTARQGNRETVKLILHSQKTVETLKKERETKLFEFEEEYPKKVRELVYLGEKAEDFYKFVRRSIFNKYSKENVFRTVLLSQMNENWCASLMRNKHYLDDNKETFERAFEEFLELLRQNPYRITNIHYLLKAVNEYTPKQEAYDLTVEKLLNVSTESPAKGGGKYIDSQGLDSNFIDYFNEGILYLRKGEEGKILQLLIAMFSFQNTMEEINGHAIPFSLVKQQSFEEGDEKFDYHGKKIKLLKNILEFVKQLIVNCNRILDDSKKKYKVTLIRVKQALYGDNSIDAALEKNIKELELKGLKNLVTIKELLPTIGDKIFRVIAIFSTVFDVLMLLGLIIDIFWN